MPLAEHNNVVKALPSDRADKSFSISVLPWGARWRRSIANADRSKSSDEDLALGPIPVADQIAGGLFPAACFRELICDPFRGRMRCNAKPQNLSSTMPHNQQAVEQPKRDCRDDEQIHCRDAVGMIVEKCFPTLGRRPSTLGHILGYARLTDIDTELEELSMDPRRSPQWVYDAHLSDQPAYFQRHRWSTATRSRLPAPVRSESGAVPADNGVRLHNRQRIARVRKQSIQTNEYQSVDGAEGEFLWSSPPQNIDLLPQRPNLCLKRCSRADQIDDHPTNKPAKIPHGTTASPDSRSFASLMRFPTGTGGG